MTYSNTDKSLAISAFKTSLCFIPFALSSFVFSELTITHKDFAMTLAKIIMMGTSGMLAFSIYYGICYKIKK